LKNNLLQISSSYRSKRIFLQDSVLPFFDSTTLNTKGLEKPKCDESSDIAVNQNPKGAFMKVKH